MQTKKSVYRQSGYKNKESGEIVEFYGAEKPANLADYDLVWDNLVTTVTTTVPFVEPVATVPVSGAV